MEGLRTGPDSGWAIRSRKPRGSIAGPRGSGKSTLIRRYCDEFNSAQDDADVQEYDEDDIWDIFSVEDDEPVAPHGDIRCMVSAPVDYAARDFVLHLFAVFCRTVIHRYAPEDLQSKATGATLAFRAIDGILSLLGDMFSAGIRYAVPSIVLIYWQQPGFE